MINQLFCRPIPLVNCINSELSQFYEAYFFVTLGFISLNIIHNSYSFFKNIWLSKKLAIVAQPTENEIMYFHNENVSESESENENEMITDIDMDSDI